jgi:hypothetical protein
VITSTLLSDEPDEASVAHIGTGNSEITSIVAGTARAIAAAQTIVVAITSAGRRQLRSANAIVTPNAMLIEFS